MTENVSCLINFDVSKGIKTVEKCVKSLRQDICDCINIKYANNELREQNKKEKKTMKIEFDLRENIRERNNFNVVPHYHYYKYLLNMYIS